MRSRSSAAIGSPELCTETPTASSDSGGPNTSTSIMPFGGANRIAFVSRLPSTCASRSGSPTIGMSSADGTEHDRELLVRRDLAVAIDHLAREPIELHRRARDRDRARPARARGRAADRPAGSSASPPGAPCRRSAAGDPAAARRSPTARCRARPRSRSAACAARATSPARTRRAGARCRRCRRGRAGPRSRRPTRRPSRSGVTHRVQQRARRCGPPRGSAGHRATPPRDRTDRSRRCP